MKRMVLTLEPPEDSGLKAQALPPDTVGFIGRSSSCQIRLPDDARNVSRVHAQLFCTDGVWYVTDQSTRGTLLNGERLEPGDPRALSDGDVLGLGGLDFVARMELDVATGPLETVTVTVALVDLAQVDTARMLESALQLPRILAEAGTETEIYASACSYLATTLSPAITSVFVAVTHEDDDRVEVLARHDLPGRGHEQVEPTISQRVLKRLEESPDSVVLLTRRHAGEVLDATVALTTNCVGACLLEDSPGGGKIVLYTVGDRAFASGEKLVTEYMHLVATVARQHLVSLRRRGLTKYFSPKVIDLLMKREGRSMVEGQPRRVEATSMFFDICGSSLQLEATSDLMAFYDDIRSMIGVVTAAVFEFDGTIIDYAGDGVFAAWGVPLPQPNQAELAARCAIEILLRLRELPLKDLGGDGVDDAALFGIGIARGEVLAGALGSPAVFKYGILGQTVNLANRLEALAKPSRFNTPIVISDRVKAGLEGTGIVTRSLGIVPIEGMKDVVAHAVVPPARTSRGPRGSGSEASEQATFELGDDQTLSDTISGPDVTG
jgi:class 3 adenylate cyclase/pSer/pThr/pTyr-binding forkhead associated (FHA) protein